MNKKLQTFFAVLTVVMLIAFIILRQDTDYHFDLYYDYRFLILKGVLNTILVSVISLIGSLILGFILYLFSISKLKYLNVLANIIKELIYGTPLLVIIVITAFIIGPAFRFGGSFSTQTRHIWGVVALIFYMSPYMMNVFISGISSIPEEQYLAMELFGFTKFQKYRFIIIPQVTRILMPPMMNNFSLIIKGSALLNVLSFNELYYVLRVAQSDTYAFVEGYLILWVFYLIITIPLSQFSKLIERKWALWK